MSGSDILLSVFDGQGRVFTDDTSPGKKVTFNNLLGPGDLSLHFRDRTIFGEHKITVDKNEEKTLVVASNAFGEYTFEARVKNGDREKQRGVIAVSQLHSGEDKQFDVDSNGLLVLVCPFEVGATFSFIVNPAGVVTVEFSNNSKWAPLINVETGEQLPFKFSVNRLLKVKTTEDVGSNVFNVSPGSDMSPVVQDLSKTNTSNKNGDNTDKPLQTGGEEQGDIFILPP